MNNFPYNGVFAGTTLIQQSGSIGGARSVFVKLQGIKNELVYPTFGGQLKNPFKVPAKIFAGDLFEFRTDNDGVNPSVYLLKTFEVADDVAESGTTIYIVRDAYRHIPCVGDVLMAAPADFSTQGAGYAITAVEETVHASKAVWEVTIGTTLGALTKGDILVEAAESGAAVKMLVQNPNSVAPSDYDMFLTPTSSATTNNVNSARYYLTPALHGIMYKSKMSKMPAVVEGINKSRINGWFEI